MPLLWLSTAFLAGIFLAAWLPPGWGLPAALAGCGLGLWLLERCWLAQFPRYGQLRRTAPLPIGALLLALAAGAGRYQATLPQFTAHDLAWYNDRGSARLVGVIGAPPERRDRATLLYIQAEEITPLGEENPARRSRPVTGRLLARVAPGEAWQYGDRLELVGRPQTPPEFEDFSYRNYLARRGVYTYLPYARAGRLQTGQGSPLLAAIYALRQRAYQTLMSFFPQPEAGLLAGILLGIESDISPGLKAAFQATGTSHIVAISGFNIAILAGLFSTLAGRFLRHFRALLFTLAGVAFYTVLVGAQPSVVRAAVMGGFGLLGAQIGRRQSGANTLAFTAALMSLFNPRLPWDVGFQLSFAATLGLILYAQPLQNGFTRLAQSRLPPAAAQRLAGPVSEYLLFTLAAQVTTLPIILYHFKRVSLSALLANPLILPPQPAVMVLGGLAVLAGMVLPWLGQALAYLTWPVLAYTVRVAETLANLPGGQAALEERSLLGVILFYLLLFGLTLGRKRLGVLLRLRNAAAAGRAASSQKAVLGLLAGLALAAVFAWQNVLTAPNGRLQVWLMDVSGGPALLVKAPGGGTALINGSNRASELSSRLSRYLPLMRHRLDWLVVATPAAAPLEGLPGALERFPARQALWQAEGSESQAGARLAALLKRQGTPLYAPIAGQRLALGPDVSLEVLAVTETGCALLLEMDRFRLLIPGGAPLATLQRRAPARLAGLSALLLTAGDLKRQALADWEALAPLLVLTAGDGAAPEAGAIQRMQAAAGGWVGLTTDGRRLWLERGK